MAGLHRNARVREGAAAAGDVGAEAAMRAVALDGIRTGKSMREIAVDLYGADAVATDWHGGGWMRAKVRRLVYRARDASGAGLDDACPGTP